MKKKTYKVEIIEKSIRLDLYLAELLNISRAQVQKLIKDEAVTLNGNLVKASAKVFSNDEICVTEIEVETFDLEPYPIPLDIVFEDEYIVVINKDAGLVVHPSFGHRNDTLVNALVARFQSLSNVGGEYRPGIVHRLDKDTSGLIIVCKTNKAHNAFAAMMKEHEVERRYTALVLGSFTEDAGMIKSYLKRSAENYQKMAASPREGKLAITHFKVLERFARHTLLELTLETGRTHQIRAHLEHLNAPIEGDPLYGRNNTKLYNKGQLLHAYELIFTHPFTHQKIILNAPLPPHFTTILTNLRTNP